MRIYLLYYYFLYLPPHKKESALLIIPPGDFDSHGLIFLYCAVVCGDAMCRCECACYALTCNVVDVICAHKNTYRHSNHLHICLYKCFALKVLLHRKLLYLFVIKNVLFLETPFLYHHPLFFYRLPLKLYNKMCVICGQHSFPLSSHFISKSGKKKSYEKWISVGAMFSVLCHA